MVTDFLTPNDLNEGKLALQSLENVQKMGAIALEELNKCRDAHTWFWFNQRARDLEIAKDYNQRLLDQVLQKINIDVLKLS